MNCRKRSKVTYFLTQHWRHCCGGRANIAIEIKCTGDKKSCSACEMSDSTCVYKQGRRDRLKELEKERDIVVMLLKDLHQSMNTYQKKIQDTLKAVSNVPLRNLSSE